MFQTFVVELCSHVTHRTDFTWSAGSVSEGSAFPSGPCMHFSGKLQPSAVSFLGSHEISGLPLPRQDVWLLILRGRQSHNDHSASLPASPHPRHHNPSSLVRGIHSSFRAPNAHAPDARHTRDTPCVGILARRGYCGDPMHMASWQFLSVQTLVQIQF